MDEIYFTFIIPHRKSESIEETKARLRSVCQKLGVSFEIFDVCGNQPTFQRNRCIEQSKGKYIYFLDNDSILPKKSLEVAYEALDQNQKIGILGGPSLPKENDSHFQTTLAKLFSSYLAVGPSSARYCSRGELRPCNDQALILCNLIIKKSVFDDLGLFNETLYPNEENEFIDRSINNEVGVYHHPKVCIHRSHRETYYHFFKQMFGYGRGRAEQTKVSPKSFKRNLLLPIIFPFYILLLIFLLINNVLSIYSLPTWSIIVYMPMGLYLILILAIMCNIRLKGIERIHFPFVYFISHIAYGLGFIKGFIFPKAMEKVNPEIYYLNKE